jgi:hypothetical protein
MRRVKFGRAADMFVRRPATLLQTDHYLSISLDMMHIE